MFRGFWTVYLQTVIGFACFFATYEVIKEAVPFEQGTVPAVLWKINAAGIAGIMRWLPPLPLDVIKSKQMTHVGPKPLTMLEAYR